jgi:HK97 family phage portal protein
MARLPSVERRGSWGSEFVKLSVPEETLPQFINRMTGASNAPVYRLPSVRQSLGVPAIQRAVSLIAGTTGMLTIQAYRNGAVMDTPPSVVSRPDPYSTPQAFFGGTAAQVAKYGEFVWWIASRDADGQPSALVMVPLHELEVKDNPDNRLLPRYRWGEKRSTRYSPANRQGAFVHVKYPLAEPFALRGEGPLQLCKAATSVTVEAQDWAANFYADGGHPAVIVKKAGILGTEPDDNGLYEADRLRVQWIDRAHNTTRIIDDNIDSVDYKEPSVAGAQMLEARQFQNGDAARMFGIAGSLLEYQQPGSSLTYQNLEGEFTKFVRTCLQPLYLEPIEQALSDLLTRSTAARFNVDGFLRADIKTRYEVHGIAIDKGIYDAVYAQKVEGIAPGDPEFQAIPFAPPSAVPTPIRAASTNVRCPKCNKLVARTLGPGSAIDCPRCKTTVTSAGVDLPQRNEVTEVHVHLPEGMVNVTNPATMLRVDMPDTGARIDAIGSEVKDLAASLSAYAEQQAAEQASTRDELTEVAKANRAIAGELAKSNRPRVIKPDRDATTHQIVSLRSEVA